ncbi:T9SS type A sorting domain-containing protein [candidate division KSB1 bacterium]
MQRILIKINSLSKTAEEELRVLGLSVTRLYKLTNIMTDADGILDNNYPNPFNPETNINFLLKKAGKVRITVYNVLGQKVKSIIDEYRREGIHKVTWNGTNNYGDKVSSGVYFYRLIVNGKVLDTKKMLMVK